VPAAIDKILAELRKQPLPLRDLNRQLQAVKQCSALQIDALIEKFGLKNLADRVIKEVGAARALTDNKQEQVNQACENEASKTTCQTLFNKVKAFAKESEALNGGFHFCGFVCLVAAITAQNMFSYFFEYVQAE
jgi:hypothetical protein